MHGSCFWSSPAPLRRPFADRFISPHAGRTRPSGPSPSFYPARLRRHPGLREIKAAGGMAMVQKEEQAKYDSMPRSAIETGMVDFILPVEKMGELLAQYIRHPYLDGPGPGDGGKGRGSAQRIFLLIRNQTGHDFSRYKRNTIRRRIARRLAVHQIEDLDHYIKLLQQNAEEVDILAGEMLITVTNFFRDREAWESLAEQVIRRSWQKNRRTFPCGSGWPAAPPAKRPIPSHPLPRADSPGRKASPPADLRDRSR